MRVSSIASWKDLSSGEAPAASASLASCDSSPRHETTVVVEFEQPLDRLALQQRVYSLQPDGQPLGERTGLPYPRDDDNRGGGRLGEKLEVLGEEQQAVRSQHLAGPPVGNAAQVERDDMFRIDARPPKSDQKRKREVLVEQDFHEAFRTAGAW